MKPDDEALDGMVEIFSDNSAKSTAISVADIKAHPERLRDYLSGRKSRTKGTEAAHKKHGTPDDRELIKQAVRDKYARMRQANPTALVAALHAAIALQFGVTQRTIRRYLKK